MCEVKQWNLCTELTGDLLLDCKAGGVFPLVIFQLVSDRVLQKIIGKKR